METIIGSSRVVKGVRRLEYRIDKSNFARTPTNEVVNVILTAEEIKQILGGRVSGVKLLQKSTSVYHKYFYSFISSCSAASGATRPKNLGKLHSFFKQRKFRSLNEWKRWYNKKMPGAIDKAVETIYGTMVQAMSNEGSLVTLSKRAERYYRKHVRMFVEDLVYDQTFSGLKIQEVILAKMAEIRKTDYRWATSKEDSSGIDGYVGTIPVSIKPNTCQFKKKAGVKRINYTKNVSDETLSFTFSM